MEKEHMILVLAVLLAIGVAIFPYVLWMTYLRGNGGRGRSQLRVVPAADPRDRPDPTLSRGDTN
jgi:hypothetical protein